MTAPLVLPRQLPRPAMAYAAVLSPRPVGGQLNGFRHSANTQAVPADMKKCGHCQVRWRLLCLPSRLLAEGTLVQVGTRDYVVNLVTSSTAALVFLDTRLASCSVVAAAPADAGPPCRCCT